MTIVHFKDLILFTQCFLVGLPAYDIFFDNQGNINTVTGADIHKTRYKTDVLDFDKRYRSATGPNHVYERGVPDIVLQHKNVSDIL